MKLKDAEKMFREFNKEFIEANKGDRVAVGLAYDYFVDGLVKDGSLTQRQWLNHRNPFYQGKF